HVHAEGVADHAAPAVVDLDKDVGRDLVVVQVIHDDLALGRLEGYDVAVAEVERDGDRVGGGVGEGDGLRERDADRPEGVAAGLEGGRHVLHGDAGRGGARGPRGVAHRDVDGQGGGVRVRQVVVVDVLHAERGRARGELELVAGPVAPVDDDVVRLGRAAGVG